MQQNQLEQLMLLMTLSCNFTDNYCLFRIQLKFEVQGNPTCKALSEPSEIPFQSEVQEHPRIKTLFSLKSQIIL